MPDDPKNSKPFAASQPRIPGVPQSPSKQPSASNVAEPVSSEAPAKRALLYLWAGAAATVVILFVVVIWWARASSRHAPPSPHIVAVSAPAPPVAAPIPALPVAPGPVATTEELSAPWTAKKFIYRNSAGDTVPAMVVHLTGSNYWAFSMRAPYGTCELQFVNDLGQLASNYGLTATHPMVADPCAHTLYDLSQYTSDVNGLVRGAVVAGMGIRPPLAIEVEIRGHEIVATHIEPR